MKEATITSWDDLAAANGERVRATSTVIVSLNGLQRELDLSTGHREELEKFLKPYLEAGRKPEQAVDRPARGYNYRPGAKQIKADMRAWADAQIAANPELVDEYDYTTPSGNYYYRQALKDAYYAATGIRA